MSIFKKAAITWVVVSSVGLTSFAYAESDAAIIPRANNWYVQGLGGVSLLGDRRIGGFLFFPDTSSFQYKPGFDISAAAGYRTGSFRFELQYSYIRNKIRKIDATTVVDSTDSLSLDMHLGMFNAYYASSNLGPTLTPYIGAGFGFYTLNTHYDRGSTFNQFKAENLAAIALQAIAGVDFNIDNNWSIGPRYRFVAANLIPYYGRATAHLFEIAITYNG